jgi:hypothetical protein
MAAQHPPHPVGGEPDRTPARLGQLGGDPGRAEAGMPEGEGDHPLLDQHTGGIGHAGWSTFPWPEDLGAVAVQLPLPAVIGRGMNAHRSTGGPDIAELTRHGKDP